MAALPKPCQPPRLPGQCDPRRVTDGDDRAGLYQRRASNSPKHWDDVGIGVGRVHDHEVVRLDIRPRAEHEGANRHRVHGGSIGEFGVCEIGPHDGRGGSMLVHEIAPLRAARQRLDADAAGSGIEIEHADRRDAETLKHRKERALDLVGHRTGEGPGRPLQPKPLRLAGNHPHRRHSLPHRRQGYAMRHSAETRTRPSWPGSCG